MGQLVARRAGRAAKGCSSRRRDRAPHLLDPPVDERWRGIRERSREDPPISRDDLEGWSDAIERPADDEHLVEEALCFGWIDSTVNTLDDDRALQLMTPQKAKSGWTRLNRQRVAAMEAAGRMTDAGRAVVEGARANGWWTRYDSVEDLIEPPELQAALDASPSARAAWDGFPPSARKQMLWWVVSAAKPETVAARVAKIVAEAEHGRRAQG